MNPFRGAWVGAVFIVALLIAVSGVCAERLTVASPVGNVRSGPGTDNPVMWQVERYHPLSIVEKQGPWYRFQDFEKDQGWIHNSLLDDIPAVITDHDTCNVRSGPGMDSAVLFQVGRGIPFKVVGKQGQWIHIEHADGDTGWIHRSLVW